MTEDALLQFLLLNLRCRAYFKSTRALFKQDRHAENRSQVKNKKKSPPENKNIAVVDALLRYRTCETGMDFDTNKRRIMKNYGGGR